MEHQKVWVPCDQEGFTLGVIQDISSDGATVLTFRQGKTLKVAYDSLYQSGENVDLSYDDNCALMFLNEGSLLNNLRIRYEKDQIYTYVANILIAINPYFDISNLYSKKAIELYQGKSLGTLPPHVFALADKSFRDLKSLKQSQSIIVSGESGAGKTENCKYVLRYLCESWGNQSGQIEKLILDANPVLESFGNAKTVRNNNSSRFGKFIEIHFNNQHGVVGGHISHYLLEKSRVISQSRDERNYHIFYQLIAGLDRKQFDDLQLKQPGEFHYLAAGCTRFFGKPGQTISSERFSPEQRNNGILTDAIVNDLNDFQKLEQGLQHFGLDVSKRTQIYRVVAACLHLGNIDFEEQNNDARGGCTISVKGEPYLRSSARLLQIEPDSLRQCLLSRVMQTAKGGAKGTVYLVPLKLFECRNARDALAKALYSRLFDHLVSRVINASMPYFQSSNYIGVLDIAGFEYFEDNGFEQFCINYCNEKLQQFFNERILLEEQRIYKTECLQLKQISFQDNSDCLVLIERVPSGILHLLDEEGRLPRSSSAHFTEQVHQSNANHFHLAIPRKSPLKCYRNLRNDEGFIVRHFAGAVCYRTERFLDKNNDALHNSLQNLMLESEHSLVKQLFESTTNGVSTVNGGKLSLCSVSGKFKSQLNELMQKLRETGTHFIRCIKPNQAMVKKRFEGANVLSQLRCSGMKSVLELMHQGYPSRTSFGELYKMYEEYLPNNLRKLEPRLFCRILFKAIGLTEGDYKFGLTKVFFKAGKFSEFDQLMKSDPKNLHQLISKVAKYLITTRWKMAQWAALSVIKLKNKILYRREKILIIQSNLRMCNAVAHFRPLIKGLIKIRGLETLCDQIQVQIAKLNKGQEKLTSEAGLAKTKQQLQQLKTQLKTDQVPGFSAQERKKLRLSTEYEDKMQVIDKQLGQINGQIEQLVGSMKERLQQQQQLLQMQKKVEEEKKRLEAEEHRRQEEDQRRKKKEELELRRKSEELKVEQQQKQQKATAHDFRLTEDMIKEDDLQRKRLEQEKLDRDLALRLANEIGSSSLDLQPSPNATEISYATVNLNEIHISPGQELDLSKWKYSELRDIINTSCDLALLECCRKEFHRRLKVYHAWKMRNTQQQRMAQRPEEQRAPDSIMHNALVELNSADSAQKAIFNGQMPEQRYFRIPFVRPSSLTGEKGWWWAHFNGEFVARQMELHPNKQPLLLVAGKHDMQMCELSLEETRLTSKRGAEILAEEFEQEWRKQGGQPWSQ